MSHRVPMHQHPRAITLDLGLYTVTIGSDDDSTTATSTTAASTPSAESSNSEEPKSSKTTKNATSSKSSASSSSSDIAAPSTTRSTSSITSTSTSLSITSTSTSSHSVAAATTSAVASSSHSSHTSPGLIAFAVLVSLAFVGAIGYVLIMRKHQKQREWTFQEHHRIFARFDKSNDDEDRPTTSRTVESVYPPMPTGGVDDRPAWSAGTGATVITTGQSVVRNLDWDHGPEKHPQEVIEKPRRKPVPPPKEVKKKTFSQYLPYLLPQNHSAEIIELGKAQQQVYQRPIYKPAG